MCGCLVWVVRVTESVRGATQTLEGLSNTMRSMSAWVSTGNTCDADTTVPSASWHIRDNAPTRFVRFIHRDQRNRHASQSSMRKESLDSVRGLARAVRSCHDEGNETRRGAR